MFYVYSETDRHPRIPYYFSDCLEHAVDWGKLNAKRENWPYWWIETFGYRVVYLNEDGQETYTYS